MDATLQIDQLIAALTDWRGKTLAEIRRCIVAVDAEIVEEWKWKGSPVWSHHGIIAVANAHKAKVKLTFYHGANLADANKLFNAGLDGNAWRAIDFFEADHVDSQALTALVLEAVEFNLRKKKAR